ncbi:MAG: hypothetical protein QY323_00200 [Patescibacteria group bacterium]|nr:MAG: hypothetical protein QY323_00200 [Patescibacteria group bacterium]
MNKVFLMCSLLFLGFGCGRTVAITTFEECVEAGNAVMESYPRQCRAGGTTFVEQLPEPPAPETESSVDITLGEAFTLQPGQTGEIDGGVRLTLLGINDSRCPADVQCIWAGELTAHLRLDVSEETPSLQEFFLGTARGSTTRVSGYAFTLKDASEERVTLVVTR